MGKPEGVQRGYPRNTIIINNLLIFLKINRFIFKCQARILLVGGLQKKLMTP